MNIKPLILIFDSADGIDFFICDIASPSNEATFFLESKFWSFFYRVPLGPLKIKKNSKSGLNIGFCHSLCWHRGNLLLHCLFWRCYCYACSCSIYSVYVLRKRKPYAFSSFILKYEAENITTVFCQLIIVLNRTGRWRRRRELSIYSWSHVSTLSLKFIRCNP